MGTQRGGRVGAMLVAVSLSCAMITACTSGSSGVEAKRSSGATQSRATANSGASATSASEPAGAGGTAVGSTPTEAAPPEVAYIINGVLTDAALESAVGDGKVSDDVLTRIVDDVLALPPADQLALTTDLSRRFEHQAAALSGLEAALGGPEASDAATTAAWLSLSSVTTGLDAPIVLDVVPQSFTSRTAPPLGASGVGLVGVVLGATALSLLADTVVSSSNDLKAGEAGTRELAGSTESSSTKVTGQLDTAGVEMNFNGMQDGVAVTSKTAMTVHPCPDATGMFTAEAHLTTSTSAGGAGHNSTINLQIIGQVDDNADLVSKNIGSHTQWADSSGGAQQLLDFGFAESNGQSSFALNRAEGEVTAGFTQTAVVMSAIVTMLVADSLIKAAQKGWQSGRCVNLQTSVSDGPTGLDPDAKVTITAQPRAKSDGAAAGGIVTALLSGGEAAVDPSSTPLPADAEFTYTAPAERDKTGRVSLESRSKRGVGKAEVDLDTKAEPAFSASGGAGYWIGTGTICSLEGPFVLDGSGLTATATPSDDHTGTYTLTGDFGGVTWDGGGTYTVVLADDKQSGTMTLDGLFNSHTPGGNFSREDVTTWALTAIDPC